MSAAVLEFSTGRRLPAAEIIDARQLALLRHNLRSAAIAMAGDHNVLLSRLCHEFGYDGDMLSFDRTTLRKSDFERVTRRLLDLQIEGLGYGWRMA